METCSNCGKENELGSKYCEECGSLLDKDTCGENKLSRKNCPNCGKNVDLNSKFCDSCGHPLMKNITSGNLSNNCPNCGKNVGLQSKFCDSCGHPLIGRIVKPKTICKFCGSEIPTGAQKCMRCGEWIDKRVEDSQFNGMIVIGYLFTFFGGWIGLIIALYLASRDNQKARTNGYIMLIISIIVSIIVLIFLIAIISTPTYPRYYY